MAEEALSVFKYVFIESLGRFLPYRRNWLIFFAAMEVGKCDGNVPYLFLGSPRVWSTHNVSWRSVHIPESVELEDLQQGLAPNLSKVVQI